MQLGIRTKFTVLFLAAGVLPVIVASWVAWDCASERLEAAAERADSMMRKQVAEQLSAVRDSHSAALEKFFANVLRQTEAFAENKMVLDAARGFQGAWASYLQEIGADPTRLESMRSDLADYYHGPFATRFREKNSGAPVDTEAMLARLPDTGIALQSSYIANNPQPLGSKHLLDATSDGSSYSALHASVHPTFRRFLEKFGFYDIFLAEPTDGQIVYSVFKELDYGTSLTTGSWASTSLGKAFQLARESANEGRARIVDFEPYRPSYDDPAGFVGVPVRDGEEVVAIALFQLSPEWIQGFMDSHSGLGETGDNYLIGSDHLARSTSLQRADEIGFVSAFRTNSRIENDAVLQALRGESGVMTLEHDGVERLTAYAPVNIGELRWAMLVDITADEAFAAAHAAAAQAVEDERTLVRRLALAGLFSTIAIIVMAIMIAKRLTSPLQHLSSALGRVANNDLTAEVSHRSGDEVGDLAEACRTMISGLANTVVSVRCGAQSASDASSQVRVTAESLSEQSQNQAAALQEASASVEEISGAARQNADNAAEADRLAATARDVALRGGEVIADSVRSMEAIKDASRRIAEIIGTIDDIAFQTNLLALNAAVEAARAGEQGRGFAVVATEVRSLAGRSATAAKEIKQLIQDALEKVASGAEKMDKSGSTLEEIVSSVKRVADIVAEIAGASREQSIGLTEITTVVSKMDQVTQSNAQQADQLLALSQTLEDRSTELRQLVQGFRVPERVSATRSVDPSPTSLDRSEEIPKAPPMDGARRSAQRVDNFVEF